MSIMAIVENDSIKLPPGVHLPDGTMVRIESVPAEGRQTLLERMKEFAGCIEDGPTDLAAEHDHYAHGAPKRTAK